MPLVLLLRNGELLFRDGLPVAATLNEQGEVPQDCCCEGGIVTPCCDNSIPEVLTAQVVFPGGSPCGGPIIEVTLTYNPISEQWATSEIICGDFGDTVQLFMECDEGILYLSSPAQPGAQVIGGMYECDPFYAEFDASGSFGFPGGSAIKVIVFA